jgi:hypothetical protein
MDLTTAQRWLTNQRNFPNSESSKTLKICIVSSTLREITQWETAVSSLIDTQEKVIRGTRKKTTRKKGEDNIEDKGFQQSKGTITVIFDGILGSRSKHQDKLAL